MRQLIDKQKQITTNSMPAKKKESKKSESTTTSGPSKEMLALFKPPVGFDLNKIDRRNAPTLCKPKDVPEGGVISGRIVKFIPSPNSAIKGLCIWLEHVETKQEFLFPCTGVIRQALAPGVKADDLAEALKAEVGNIFIAKKLANGFSDKYQKEMFDFEVYTLPQSE